HAAAWTWHDRPRIPEPGSLSQATFRAGYGPELTEESDLADGDRPRSDRTIPQGRGKRDGKWQVESGLTDRNTAGDVRVGVLGPARLPSLVTWPTSTTAIPPSFASCMYRNADSRTCPTLPAGPSSSSTTAVWIESTITTVGRSRRAASRTAATSLSGNTLTA